MQEIIEELLKLEGLKEDDPDLVAKATTILTNLADMGGDVFKQRVRDIFEVASDYYVSQIDTHSRDETTNIWFSERTWSIQKK